MALGKKSAAKKGIDANNSSIMTNLGEVLQYNFMHTSLKIPITIIIGYPTLSIRIIEIF